MTFEWDEDKNRANMRKHGLDFAEAEEMFRGVLVAEPDMREDLRRKALEGNRHHSRANGRSHFCRACTPDRSNHLVEKGTS